MCIRERQQYRCMKLCIEQNCHEYISHYVDANNLTAALLIEVVREMVVTYSTERSQTLNTVFIEPSARHLSLLDVKIEKSFGRNTCYALHLSTFASNTTSKLNILGHDRHLQAIAYRNTINVPPNSNENQIADMLGKWHLPVWRGWHTDLCPQTRRQDRPQWLPGVQGSQCFGSEGHSWSPVQSHGRDVEMATITSETSIRWLLGIW